ncbi:MAG: methyltransferase domain-containing protein, partial [Psychrosphaera sp.]|nr:methyltransferase domain-containing protein [Psychrosphaera sp.]
QLSDFSKKNRITMNTLVQGVWSLLLSRYASQTTIAFGAIVAGRPSEIEGVEQGSFQEIQFNIPKWAKQLVGFWSEDSISDQEFINADGANLPFDDNEFDYVICTGVIHHNAAPEIPLKTLYKALKKDGILELMVYNYYHRIMTTAFQKAIRTLCSNTNEINVNDELPVCNNLIEQFPLDNYMADFLHSHKGRPEAEIADALLQPVEYSYTVESLNALAQAADLDILHPCINHYDIGASRYNWNIDFENPQIKQQYLGLPDVQRWQVSNLLMENESPMVWFYLQRKDATIARKTEQQICTEFLATTFTKTATVSKNYVLTAEGEYSKSARNIPCPAPSVPQNPLFKSIYQWVDGQTSMQAIFDKLNIEVSFDAVNKIRVGLTGTGFPYLRVVS